MWTDALVMQSHGSFHYRKPELDLEMASHISLLFGTQDGSDSSPHCSELSTAAINYIHFPITNTPTPEGLHAPDTKSAQVSSSTEINERPRNEAQCSYPGFGVRSAINTTGPSALHTSALYSSPLMLTATNTTAHTQQATPLSTLQNRFDQDQRSPNTGGGFTFNGMSQVPTGFTYYTADGQQAPCKVRSDSLHMSLDGSSPTTKQPKVGRRRKSEFIETGSARAIYLEKNRKAASKCRNKQKRQQEELVETARDVERRNRVLKTEVEMLKGNMRELMNIVGQHTDCPDTRLKLYVQREADKLVTGVRTPYQHPASSATFSHGTLSPEHLPSPNQ